MKALDAGKAVGIAMLIMAFNVLIAFILDFIFAEVFEPGHPQAFYSAAAPRLADWSAPLGGGVSFFIIAYALARRRPERSAIGFALLIWLAYVIIDIGSGAAMGDVHAMLTPLMAASMGLALAAALLGAVLAKRGHVAAMSQSRLEP